METWKRLEFEYAARLRSADEATRRTLYADAYSDVGRHRVFDSSEPEHRTAGTSPALVRMLSKVVGREDRVLEIGCGRGYTCLMLAPHVRSIVGTDVSGHALAETRELLAARGVGNVTIVDASATDLVERLDGQRFDTAISIEVYEHLHPDDGAEHLRQVHALLEPGGRYVIVMPNRLNGPHDITREEFPDSHVALGFHLNESTYGQTVQIMRKIGYRGFRSFHSLRGRVVTVPCVVSRGYEAAYAAGIRPLGNRLLSVRLIAYK